MANTPSANELMYARELQSFFGILGMNNVLRDIRETYPIYLENIQKGEPDSENSLHPLSFMKEFLKSPAAEKNFSMDKKQIDALEKIFNKSFPTDEVTGYGSLATMPPIVGIAHYNAQGSEYPVIMVEADVANLGGCNFALGDGDPAAGREKTDKLIYEMAKITQEALKKANRGNVQVHAVRSGGDELRLLIYGATQEEINNILKYQVVPQINIETAKLGLNDAKHTKMGKLPGVSISFGTSDIRGKTPAEIQMEIADQIELEKKIDSFMRFGLVDEKGITRYMEEFFIPSLEAEQPNLNQTEKNAKIEEERVKVTALIPVIKKRWEDIKTSNPELFKDAGDKNPNEFFAELAKEVRNSKFLLDILAKSPLTAMAGEGVKAMVPLKGSKYERQNLEELQLPSVDSEALFPEVPIILADGLSELPKAKRLRAALNEAGFDEIANFPQLLLTWDPSPGVRDKVVNPAVMDHFFPDLEKKLRSATKKAGHDTIADFDEPLIKWHPKEQKYVITTEISRTVENLEEKLRASLIADGYDAIADFEKPLIQWDNQFANYVINDEAVDSFFSDCKRKNTAEYRTFQLFVNACKYMDADNSVSRCTTSRFAVPDTLALMNTSDNVASFTFELQNMSGLNNVKYELGNAVIRDAARIIKEEMFGAVKDGITIIEPFFKPPETVTLYDAGNGKLSLVTSNVTPERFAELEVKIAPRLEDEIFNQPVKEFAEATCANVNGNRTRQESEAILKVIRDKTDLIAEKSRLPPITKMNEIPHPKTSTMRIGLNTEYVALVSRDPKILYQQINYACGEKPKNNIVSNSLLNSPSYSR